MLERCFLRDRLLACVFALAPCFAAAQEAASTHLVEQAPVAIRQLAAGDFLVDYGRVAFGNLVLQGLPVTAGAKKITLRFGESIEGGRVNTRPPGSVRFAEVSVTPEKGRFVVAPDADLRNTTAPAVLTPPAMGVLLPFRWVEVQGWPGALNAAQITRRAAFDSSWHDDAGQFRSSDAMLDRIWDLCHYSIKATTFAGVFVDGDRERLAYEADAYLDQLGYYDGDADPTLPRVTFDRLMKYPTWPSEWAPHMVFIAYADWMQTGDKAWLAAHYEGLKTKLLTERVGADGLVESSPQQIRRGDLVDWPVQERDGYVFTPVSTVVNSFHLRALAEMSTLAEALGKSDEASAYAEQQRAAAAAFQQQLFDPKRGLYRDGTGTEHASLHANLFPLAFGLVPADKRRSVAQWLASRGMAGSVYAAQYLLEGLFENGESAAALALMTAPGDRSWRHMVDSGATITWEAWDNKYKPNQDWNHAWGAAPANLLPRYVLGVQPFTPGWGTVSVAPHPGSLTSAEGQVPTPRGEIKVSWTATSAGKTPFRLNISLPRGMKIRVSLPASERSRAVLLAGKPLAAHRTADRWVVDAELDGAVILEERE